MLRRRIYYTGRVQGVGFRYVAKRLAAGYELGGFVRNLPDGRVELLIEGPAEQVTAFADALAESMTGYIRDSKKNDEPYLGEFDRFDVRF